MHNAHCTVVSLISYVFHSDTTRDLTLLRHITFEFDLKLTVLIIFHPTGYGFSEFPLMVSIIHIAWHQRELVRLWMNRNAFLVQTMQQCFGGFVILPWPINRAHAAEC